MHHKDTSYCHRTTWQYSRVAVDAALHGATAPGRTKRLASLIICISRLRRFHMLSCHSRPDRRGHVRRITHRLWLLRSSPCCLRFPALQLGRPQTAWPGAAAFPCSVFDTGGFRSALLHRQFSECTPGHVRRPGLDCLPFGSSLKQPRMAGFAFTMLTSI